MHPDARSDHDLWQSLKQGDRQAFAALYQRHYRALYGYGYKLLPNVNVVEDAIQDLFVDVWRLRHNLADVDSVKFYLFRSLRRTIHRLGEKENHRDLSIDDSFLPPVQPTSEWVDQQQAEQIQHRIRHLLHQLPDRQLEVVTLRFYENFKTDEIAQIMGITDKSVRNTLHKALVHLRQQAHYLAPFLGLLLLWLLA